MCGAANTRYFVGSFQLEFDEKIIDPFGLLGSGSVVKELHIIIRP